MTTATQCQTPIAAQVHYAIVVHIMFTNERRTHTTDKRSHCSQFTHSPMCGVSDELPITRQPTARLLSFALCLEWINGIYNTPDAGCLECYRSHASVNTTTPKIDRKHIHCRNILDIRTRYEYEINDRTIHATKYAVFINGKQVKTDKITQIVPWFPRHNNYRQLTASLQPTKCVNSHLCTVTTPTNEGFRLQPVAGTLKVGRRYKCVSK